MSDGPKRALLVVAHGSRRAASNDEIRDLVVRMRASERNSFEIIEAGFLELAEPSIPDGIECCIRQGARQVLVYPYFLSAGRHVAEDIPAEVKGKQAEYPHLDIRVADYLGASEGLAGMIFDQLEGAGSAP